MLPLSGEKARIFRITHVDNVPWVLRHGIHCRSSALFDPNYRSIGNPELIQKRASRKVPIQPGGTLSDYVPFYFTSRSPMLLNLKTGQNVPAVAMRDIVILVASLHQLAERGIPFVYTDRHAYLLAAQFSSDIADLERIDWGILRASDFKYDGNDPAKMDRYQAEALVYQSVPADALAGMICYDQAREAELRMLVAQAGHGVPVVARPEYFF